MFDDVTHLFISNARTVPSSDADKTTRPSFVNSDDVTAAEWFLKVVMEKPVVESHTFTWLIFDDVIYIE